MTTPQNQWIEAIGEDKSLPATKCQVALFPLPKLRRIAAALSCVCSPPRVETVRRELSRTNCLVPRQATIPRVARGFRRSNANIDRIQLEEYQPAFIRSPECVSSRIRVL
ncbi:hypothetical protein R1flu_018278 [Riccia fluitans]|uniref:Uncharacterized protein n=1 Tax=Riccia fluitans TaxID=41844 RepID=A0ABD1ZGN8_9MARC